MENCATTSAAAFGLSILALLFPNAQPTTGDIFIQIESLFYDLAKSGRCTYLLVDEFHLAYLWQPDVRSEVLRFWKTISAIPDVFLCITATSLILALHYISTARTNGFSLQSNVHLLRLKSEYTISQVVALADLLVTERKLELGALELAKTVFRERLSPSIGTVWYLTELLSENKEDTSQRAFQQLCRQFRTDKILEELHNECLPVLTEYATSSPGLNQLLRQAATGTPVSLNDIKMQAGSSLIFRYLFSKATDDDKVEIFGYYAWLFEKELKSDGSLQHPPRYLPSFQPSFYAACMTMRYYLNDSNFFGDERAVSALEKSLLRIAKRSGLPVPTPTSIATAVTWQPFNFFWQLKSNQATKIKWKQQFPPHFLTSWIAKLVGHSFGHANAEELTRRVLQQEWFPLLRQLVLEATKHGENWKQ